MSGIDPKVTSLDDSSSYPPPEWGPFEPPPPVEWALEEIQKALQALFSVDEQDISTQDPAAPDEL